MWGRRKLYFNIVLLIFSACFNIPGIVKIIYFCILPFQLWNNDLLFPLWKKSLTFLNFLTMLHLKQLFPTFIFSICALPRIFLAVQGGQCPLLFIYLCWLRLCHFCFLVANVNIFVFHLGGCHDFLIFISNYLSVTFIYTTISSSCSFFLKR